MTTPELDPNIDTRTQTHALVERNCDNGGTTTEAAPAPLARCSPGPNPCKEGLMVHTMPPTRGAETKARGWAAFALAPADLVPWRDKVLRYVPTGMEPNACWPWLGHVDHNGYGKLGRRGRSALSAHRASYVVLTGDSIPSDQTIDHRCGNRSCVNPRHLEVVSMGINSARIRDRGLSQFDHEHAPHCSLCRERREARRKERVNCPFCDSRPQRKHLTDHIKDRHK